MRLLVRVLLAAIVESSDDAIMSKTNGWCHHVLERRRGAHARLACGDGDRQPHHALRTFFRKLAQQGTLDQYLLQDHWHPNERGYKLVTGNVLDFITGHDMLDVGYPRGARLR